MTKAFEISIQQNRCSRIVCGEGFSPLRELLGEETEVYLLYDENVAEAARQLAQAVSLKASIAIDATEQDKSMETVLCVCRQLMEAGASRKAFLLALGGGITTDLTGFAAAIYKRGIRYANIPTTLLSQVDAAIGGKTGVNLDGYKNMLGAFHLPEFTYLMADVLSTLPPKIFREGLSEMLKTFLLADGAAYKQAVAFFSKPRTGQEGLLPFIRRAAQIKAGIVQRDPFEKGERAKLNLGHTFAHALEHEAACRAETLSHGEAVAIGTILAARLSEEKGIAEKGLAARLEADFQRLGLPTRSPYPAQTLLSAMAKDKKATGGSVLFVLPRTPGEVVLQKLELNDLHLPTE